MKVTGDRPVRGPARARDTRRAEGTEAVGGADPAEEVRPAASTRSVQDVATFLGIPEDDLTPKVREGIARLLDEVDRLRRDAESKELRIAYLERLADEDPLAPVLNRRAFVRELTRMVAHAERYGTVSSVLYFDLDGLKAINDAHGHGAGDAALAHTADILVRNTRGSDIVGRLGGDEFGVLLVQADEASALRKATDLAELVASTPVTWREATLTISASVGSFAFDGREEAQAVLDRADRAMYRRKRGVR